MHSFSHINLLFFYCYTNKSSLSASISIVSADWVQFWKCTGL